VHARTSPPPDDAAAARATVGEALKTKDVNRPEAYAALATLTGDIARQVRSYGAIKAVPAAATTNVRNDMYLALDAVRVMGAKPSGFDDADMATLKSLRSSLDSGTKFIPTWVKVSVAIALGLGTMVGWKRIVVTVGEKIGKTHLTYAQGACAEIVAMATIGMADVYGLPVSTTHVLSSGVAGTMAANRVGVAVEHDQEYGAGLGSDAPGGDGDCGVAVCDPAPGVLRLGGATGGDRCYLAGPPQRLLVGKRPGEQRSFGPTRAP
jgi:inorganic phosphate transporter, PiT family